ncbi:stalk domain-containing protein [Brevibacillus marinus]|uniref:stalk domain-containing protein n=1 Tax=Brevibacillus marinus TaxID=2496837 RepID=UPI0013E0AA80|nr:stalk domain-containing protein [Brevibacillus marinus]
MRKITFIFLICLFVFSPSAVSANPDISVFLDGNKLEFDVKPTIVNGSTLVPLRKIFEAQGATVQWDDETKTVTATKDGTVITYTIGSQTAKKNTDTILLTVPGQIINGSTMVPLRFVSEALGSTVGWEGKSRTITISSATKQKGKVLRVIEGDIIEVDLGGKVEKLYLIGADAPEMLHPFRGELPYATEASNFTKGQLEGKTVLVEFDVEQRDPFGRLLGYVYLENGTFFNATLVAEGYAQLSTIPPNVRWAELFTYLQSDARKNLRGLWSVDPNNAQTGQ